MRHPNSFTKSELIATIAETRNMSLQDAEICVNTILNTMIKAMAHGRRIELRGFGVFSIAKYEARKGRNPRTGEAVDVPAKYRPKFKAGNVLKKMVDEGRES